MLLGILYLVSILDLTHSEDSCLSRQITTGGNSNGDCCVFPFAYGNKLYTKCIDDYHNKLWCATTKNYHMDQKWGNCVEPTARYTHECKDRYTFCGDWGKRGFCHRSSTWYKTAKVNCPVTCGVCSKKLKKKGSIYYVGESKRTWGEAEKICSEWGGHLASFTSRKDETEVYKKIETGTPYWIGLYSTPDKRIYKWTDDTPYEEVFWDIGEPNGGRDEMCVGIKKWMLGFYMHDAPCTRRASFICEKKLYD